MYIYTPHFSGLNEVPLREEEQGPNRSTGVLVHTILTDKLLAGIFPVLIARNNLGIRSARLCIRSILQHLKYLCFSLLLLPWLILLSSLHHGPLDPKALRDV